MRSRKAKSRPQAEGAPPPDPIELERRRLAIVLSDDTGFRLFLATCDDRGRREALIGRLTADLAKEQVAVTRLDVAPFGPEAGLAELLRLHVEAHPPDPGWRRAVMVVGIEDLLDQRPHADGFGFLERANIQRDALPAVAPVPVVLWLTPSASAALPKVATDLWHWRAASFELTGGAETRTDILRQLTELPSERRDRLRSPARGERAAMLEELVAELDAAGPARSRREMAERITLLGELGTTLLGLGRAADARPVLQRGLELARTASDAQSEASILVGLGDASIVLGNLAGALAAYQASLAIRQALAARDPGNALWQRDLSVSHEKVGDVRVAEGDRAGALAAYQASLVIAEALAARDPGNAEWQRDLIVSHWKLADLGERRGAALEARGHWQAALEIAHEMAAGGRLAPRDTYFVGTIEARLEQLSAKLRP